MMDYAEIEQKILALPVQQRFQIYRSLLLSLRKEEYEREQQRLEDTAKQDQNLEMEKEND